MIGQTLGHYRIVEKLGAGGGKMRVLAIISILIVALGLVLIHTGHCSVFQWDLVLGLVPYVMSLLWVVASRTRRTIVTAIIVAGALLVIGAPVVLGRSFELGSSPMWWLLIVLLGLLHTGLVLSARTALHDDASGKSSAKLKNVWIGLGSILLAEVLILFPGQLIVDRTTRNEVNALGDLRTLNTAMVTYGSSCESGFPAHLGALGPPKEGKQGGCEGADILPPGWASSTNVLERSGYRFTYQPGPPDMNGRVNSYALSARSQTHKRTSSRSFFTDESGVIRDTCEDRAATAADPPI